MRQSRLTMPDAQPPASNTPCGRQRQAGFPAGRQSTCTRVTGVHGAFPGETLSAAAECPVSVSLVRRARDTEFSLIPEMDPSFVTDLDCRFDTAEQFCCVGDRRVLGFPAEVGVVEVVEVVVQDSRRRITGCVGSVARNPRVARPGLRVRGPCPDRDSAGAISSPRSRLRLVRTRAIASHALAHVR
jgi:hypothetical protein